MANNDFKEDVKDGDKGEENVRKFLTEKYNLLYISSSKDCDCGGRMKDDKSYECNKCGVMMKEVLKYWDIRFKTSNKSELIYYEVKNDVHVARGRKLPNGFVAQDSDTGNIFVEFQCRDEDSGINVTKSDWWAYSYQYLNEIWFIKVSNLKKLIKENDFKQVKRSGEKYRYTTGYLIPRKQFKEHFIVKKF